MKNPLFAVVLLLVIVACNNKRHDNAGVNTGQEKFNPPVLVQDTAALALTTSELEDDSVFADASIPTTWQNAGITDVKGLKLFLRELQQKIMLNDKEGLAATVQYPLMDIQSEQALLARYDEVFTKEVKLSFATINFRQIFRNQNGAMINGGKVWIRQIGDDFKIVAINY